MKTINPQRISNMIQNSLYNNKDGIKEDRLDWDRLSYKEAESWLTENGKDIEGRILIGIDKNWDLVIEDWRHLLEAYRRLDKEIPMNKIWFRDKEAEALFNGLY